MDEAGRRPVVDVDEPPGLQAFEHGLRQDRGLQRLAERQQFHRLPLLRVDVADGGLRQLADTRGDRHRAPPGPRAGFPGQPPARADGVDQLAQQPQVALARPVQTTGGESLHVAAQLRLDEPGPCLPGKGVQGQARQEVTRPEPRHRFRRAAVRPGQDEQASPSVHRQVVDQRRRGVVEQVGVVHDQHAHRPQRLRRLVKGDRVGQQVGERGEGDRPGSRCPGDHDVLHASYGLRPEAGLADPGRADHGGASVT